MTQFLPYLLVLACPLSMGVMMWMMMRMGGGDKDANDVRITDLEGQLRDLRTSEATQPKAVERIA